MVEKEAKQMCHWMTYEAKYDMYSHHYGKIRGDIFHQTLKDFQDEQKSENKRSLLPVVNINTGKREDRFEELKTRELQDLESESESEDEGIPKEEKDLTIEEIKKLQNEQLGQWSNRLVQVVIINNLLTYLYKKFQPQTTLTDI